MTEFNLYAMSADALIDFWAIHRGGRGPAAAMAVCAINKAAAMRCWERGEVSLAIMLDRVAEDIYNSLPDAERHEPTTL